MAEMVAQALQVQTLDVLADAGYSNGAQAAALDAQAVLAHVPANRAVNNQGDGALLPHTGFIYDSAADVMNCLSGKTLTREQLMRRHHAVVYQARKQDRQRCPLKPSWLHKEEAANGHPSPA